MKLRVFQVVSTALHPFLGHLRFPSLLTLEISTHQKKPTELLSLSSLSPQPLLIPVRFRCPNQSMLDSRSDRAVLHWGAWNWCQCSTCGFTCAPGRGWVSLPYSQVLWLPSLRLLSDQGRGIADSGGVSWPIRCSSGPSLSNGKWEHACPRAGHGVFLYKVHEIPISPFLPEETAQGETMAEQVHTGGTEAYGYAMSE